MTKEFNYIDNEDISIIFDASIKDGYAFKVLLDYLNNCANCSASEITFGKNGIYFDHENPNTNISMVASKLEYYKYNSDHDYITVHFDYRYVWDNIIRYINKGESLRLYKTCNDPALNFVIYINKNNDSKH